MSAQICNVCQAPLLHTIYRSPGNESLTSLASTAACATRVRVCKQCGHLQTDSVFDEAAFYDTGYNILTTTEEEDQLYEVVDGRPVFRTGHQVATLLRKLAPKSGARWLDYGCAKSSTYRMLAGQRPDLALHLFDVSDRYTGFWKSFVAPDRWATYESPVQWSESFDVVTSFFAFEHITAAVASLRKVAGLLRPGGTFYCIVPDVLANTADLVVVDHVNHFTTTSMRAACESAGLEVLDIDLQAHRGAMIVLARRPGESLTPSPVDPVEVERIVAQAGEVAAFWMRAGERVRDFEVSLAPDAGLAVYGAGFYGAFLLNAMRQPERVRFMLDQNPHLVGSVVNGRPVIHPASLPASVDVVLVGLNPARARAIVSEIRSLASLKTFYL